MVSVQVINIRALNNIFKTRKKVTFELILDKGINRIPYLIVYQDSFYHSNTELARQIVVRPYSSRDHSYLFELPGQQKPRYFALVVEEGDRSLYVMKKYHFEPGDCIRISIKSNPGPERYDLGFSGAGSAKYRLQRTFNAFLSNENKQHPAFLRHGKYNPENHCLKNLEILLHLLKNARMEISDYSYYLFKTDLISRTGRSLIAAFNAKTITLNDKDSRIYRLLCEQSLAGFKADFEIDVPGYIKYASEEYAWYIMEKRLFEQSGNEETNLLLIYYFIKNMEDKELRDKLIVIFFIKHGAGMNRAYKTILANALSLVKNTECLEKLKKFK